MVRCTQEAGNEGAAQQKPVKIKDKKSPDTSSLLGEEEAEEKATLPTTESFPVLTRTTAGAAKTDTNLLHFSHDEINEPSDAAATKKVSELHGGKAVQEIIPLEVFFRAAKMTEGTLSPNGKSFAYLAADKDGIVNVHVRTIGKTDDRPVTTSKEDVLSYCWEKDGRGICYIQSNQLYRSNLEGGEATNLTPEGMSAHYFTSTGMNSEPLVNAKNKDVPGGYFDLYRVNSETGKLELLVENPGMSLITGMDPPMIGHRIHF